MATDEATRHHLYEQARASWGAEAADALMQALPRDPDQLATKADLALLSGELRGEMAELRGEVRAQSGEIVHKLYVGMVASNVSLAGLIFAAIKLA